MPSRQPEEAKGFKLLGHDRSAAWGGGSIVRGAQRLRLCGRGRRARGPEGFTAHDVRDPRNPKKVYEFRAPPGVHCHKVRVVGDHHLYVNSERLAGDKGRNARAGLVHLRHQQAGSAARSRLPRHAGQRAAPLRRRQQARPGVPAQRRAGLEQAGDLDHGYPRSAAAGSRQHLGPAVAEGRGRRRGQRSDAGARAPSRCTARR